MSAHHYERLPIFALGTVLFPGGALPLKVFEHRYVEMTKACLRDGLPFGVCLIREGHEVGEPAVPAIIGCTAQIAEWDLPHPNMFHLLARGETRFRIASTRIESTGLIVCEADTLDDSASDEEPDALCRQVLASAVEKIGAERFAGPIALDDAQWVSYRLAELLPLENTLRQRLLEMHSTAERLEVLSAILVQSGIGRRP